MSDEILVNHSTIRRSRISIRGNHNIIYGSGNFIVGISNKIHGNSNKIYGNFNKIHGNSNKIHGSHNEIFGDDNEILGDWNESVGNFMTTGIRNRPPLVANGDSAAKKDGRKRKREQEEGKEPANEHSHRRKRRRIEVLDTNDRGSLVQICTTDVDNGSIGNFMSFGRSFTFDSDGGISVSGPTAVGLIMRNDPESRPFVTEVTEPANPNKDMETPKEEEEASAAEGTPEEMLCKICFDRLHNTLVVDCSHACMCVTCARKVIRPLVGSKRCPICRQAIVKGIRRIYS